MSEAELTGHCGKLHVNGQEGVRDDSGGFWHKGREGDDGIDTAGDTRR